MRSRYTAFTKGDIEYIGATRHPFSPGKFDERSARKWSLGSEWIGLEIKSTEAGGEEDSEGTVEFVASYTINGRREDHEETAHFARHDDGRWYFVDGEELSPQPVVRETPKVGRNEPCPCGSGKKFKKCCGKAS